MKGEEGLQVGLPTLEEIAEKKGQHPRHDEKNDDEHVGERRGEIAGELAAKNGQDVAHRRQAAATAAGSGGTLGDFAEDVVEPATLDPQAGDLPAMRAREIGDLCDDRAIAVGENHQCVALAVADRLDRRHPGQARQLGANLRLGTGGYAEPNGIMMARAFGELRGGPVGQNAAMRDDDRPAAYRLDLFEQVGRNNDRLLGPHCSDDPPHFILLVGVEPVGRLVEDQHLGIVQQRLRHPDPAFEALRQCFDRLMQDPGDPDHFDDTADAMLGFSAGKAADMGDEVEKIGWRHVRIGRRALRQIADALLCGDGLQS